MTCIAGIMKDGKVYLAGERGASEGNYIVPIDKPKIWKTGPYIFGFAGTFLLFSNHLRYFLQLRC